MKRERIIKDELFAAARSNGVTQLEDLAVVILETTGDITAIKKIEGENAEALSTVSNSTFTFTIHQAVVYSAGSKEHLVMVASGFSSPSI